ncbi:MAG: 50S ribosomal protein L24 [Candidatus Lernaella stagnicola]|nr:50S ribosomal protein L24 [Candidatus Lernaella stagnicola]
MRIKKGDIVHIVAGKERRRLDDPAKRGKVLKVFPETQRVLVERINIIKRHQRPSRTNQQGGIIEREAAIHVSNVRLVDPKTNNPTRVTYKILNDGTKVRIAKDSGEQLD